MQRYIPIVVFVGCALFCALHAWSLRLDDKGAKASSPEHGQGPQGSSDGKTSPPTDKSHVEDKGSTAGSVTLANHEQPLRSTDGQHATAGAGLQQVSLIESAIVANWSNKIILVQDPIVKGKAVPGLVGSIYFYTDNAGLSSEVNGTMSIAMFDRGLPGTPTQPVETWRVEASVMKQCEKRDERNQVYYQLYLPFEFNRTDISKISLSVHYDGANGKAIDAASPVLTLDTTALQTPAPAATHHGHP
jgi:hypothetical protein